MSFGILAQIPFSIGGLKAVLSIGAGGTFYSTPRYADLPSLVNYSSVEVYVVVVNEAIVPIVEAAVRGTRAEGITESPQGWLPQETVGEIIGRLAGVGAAFDWAAVETPLAPEKEVAR